MTLQRTSQLTLVLLALGALLVSGSSTALAAPMVTGRVVSTSHSISSLTPRTVTGSTGPQREVFGFALASSLGDPTIGYPSWDFSLLSTAAFFGLHVNDDGTFASDAGMTTWNSATTTNFVNAAHAKGTKVVVTIILQDFGAGTPHMCAGLRNGSTTVTNTVNQVRAKGVDGINVDYEGLNGACGTTDSSWARHAFTNFVAALRAAATGMYLSVDTYASSASDSLGFFDVGGLSKSVDSFFVMAYDLEYSNYSRAPTSCRSFCLGPTSPLGGYYYNDTSVAKQYTSVVPASKVILGVPYYGRKACVASAVPNAYPTSAVVADSYLDASQEASSNLVKPGTYAVHRDAHDPAGQERWDTWVNTSMGCIRELYWDDTVSLGHKYAIVNADGLRGVGMWNLNYGGGAPELWALLNTYFACPVSVTVAATQSTTEFNLGLSVGSCSASQFEVQQLDTTLNQGWFAIAAKMTGAGTANVVADGYAGHTYQLRVRARSAGGIVSDWTTVTTEVSGTATHTYPFSGLYTLDAYGGVNADSSGPLAGSAYWPGWKIARAAQAQPGPNSPQSGLVMDGYGVLHSYGAPITVKSSATWPGWDIARDFAFLPSGTGGYVLDGYGGLHAFAVGSNPMPPAVKGNAYWQGFDIARRVVIFSDGTGGYVMDGYGGLHPFAIGSNAVPAAATGAAYWAGWQIARDVALVPGSHAGYVLDGYGGLHAFNGAAAIAAPAYWHGFDIARSIWLLRVATPSAPSGYVLDGYGGTHPFGGAVAVSGPYWPSKDLAKMIWGG